MKTLADFKRAAKIGAVFTAFFPDDLAPEHQASSRRNSSRRRVVNFIQSNAITFEIVKGKGSGISNRSWFHFPKADEVTFEDGVMITWNLHKGQHLPADCKIPAVCYAIGEVFPEHLKARIFEYWTQGRANEKKAFDARQVEVAKMRADREAAEPKPVEHDFTNEQVLAAILASLNPEPQITYDEELQKKTAARLGMPELAADRDFQRLVYKLRNAWRDEQTAIKAKAYKDKLAVDGFVDVTPVLLAENAGKRAVMAGKYENEFIEGRIAPDGRGGHLFLPKGKRRFGYMPKLLKVIS